LKLTGFSWLYADLVEIFRRYYQLVNRAMEFATNDGQTYMVALESHEQREIFLHRLTQIDPPNLVLMTDQSLPVVTQWWRDGCITNYECVVFHFGCKFGVLMLILFDVVVI